MRVAETLDEVKHGGPGFGLRPEGTLVKEFAFECGAEVFAHRIVEAVPTEDIEGRTPAF
jgi:hypothetical protein